MRINEKSLTQFACSGTPADKEGYLLKKGEVNRGFQRRWFVLKGNLLFYYEHKGDKDPVGVIVLEDCTIELEENSDGFTFQIVFPGSSGRTYIIAAETQESMENWMKVLSCASHEYIKLMVSELQRQVDQMQVDNHQKLIEEADKMTEAFKGQYDRLSISSKELESNKNNSASVSSIDSESKEQQKTTGVTAVRYNPFNFNFEKRGMSTDSSSQSLQSQVSNSKKSFVDLHEEYRKEIELLSELWKSGTTTPTSCMSPVY